MELSQTELSNGQTKLIPLVNGDETTGYMIYCPGCKQGHHFNLKEKNPNGVGGFQAVWKFDGNLESPTFSPSLLCQGIIRCHIFVEQGKIRFLDDCSHELRGKIIDLEPW